jgi:hypothetical protein
VLLWAALRWVFRRPQIAAVFGWVAASHIVLDVIQHASNIRLAPWLAHPLLGFNLQANPWLDFAIETALFVGCWACYRGGRKLLAAIVVLNLLNLPLMVAGEGGAFPMAINPFILPTTILLAWGVTHHFAKPTRPAADAVSAAGVPAAVTA